MNRFAKRYEEDTSTYSDYDNARRSMAGKAAKARPSRSYAFRSVGNTDAFEKEYQAFINRLKAQKAEKTNEEVAPVVKEAPVVEEKPVVTETPVVEEAPVVETPAPKKRKSKVTVEETVASDDTLFG